MNYTVHCLILLLYVLYTYNIVISAMLLKRIIFVNAGIKGGKKTTIVM